MKIMLIVFIITLAYIVGMSKFEQYMSIDNMRYSIRNSYLVGGENGSEDQLSDEIEVTLSGQVVTPKKVIQKKSTTLREVISACGGLSLSADLRSINLDLIISQDLSIYIPSINVGTDKVSINTGTLEQLMSLPKIGSVYANAILQYRSNNGNFAYLEQIMNVPGIGTGTFNSIRDYIILL